MQPVTCFEFFSDERKKSVKYLQRKTGLWARHLQKKLSHLGFLT